MAPVLSSVTDALISATATATAAASVASSTSSSSSPSDPNMLSNNNYFLFGLATGVAVTAAVAFLGNFAVKMYTGAPASATAAKPTTSASGKKAEDDDIDEKKALITELSADDVAAQTLARIEPLFRVDSEKLNLIVKHMVSEMKRGLQDDKHDLKMIPSHVVRRPKGNETGSFLALDLGGTNFRVCEVILEGNGISRLRQKKFTVSDALKTGEGSKLFDFLAECVGNFLQENGSHGKGLKLGFTFSFPLNQTDIKTGELIYWTKGFSASGVEGANVGELLQQAFHRKGLEIAVSALVNDTTGTLMSHAYSHPNTNIGVILGTGTNAAYVESVESITKYTGPVLTNEMIINTEWGAFDDSHVVLPRTKYDVKVDRASTHPNLHTYEKLISGMYLGEIVRFIIVDLVKTGELFAGKGSSAIDTPYSFDTALMSRIERDHTIDLSDTKSVLEDILQVTKTTRADRRIVKGVCELVGKRSARLAAAGIAAIVTKINALDGSTVAIDGSLFELYPHYANRMRDALREMLGMSAENIVLEQARDGSGQGAALIACVADVPAL